jgi:hypothetical protein
MEPVLAAGSPVVVDTVWDGMGAGDVLCFRGEADGAWTIHRVLWRFRIGKTRYFVQAPERADVAGVVGEDRIVGIVRGPGEGLRRSIAARERLLAARAAIRWLVRTVLTSRRAQASPAARQSSQKQSKSS